jgi:hypothetical protein
MGQEPTSGRAHREEKVVIALARQQTIRYRWEHAVAVLLSMLAVMVGCLCAVPTIARACTIFTASQGDTVLFGNNEDWHSPDLIVGFTAPQQGLYGSVGVGYRHSDGLTEFAGRMNEKGLAWDVNSVPRTRLTPHPERLWSHETDNYLATITQRAATVEEAMLIAKVFDFGESAAYQVHIADATGDAAVLSPGPDGEMTFTRKPEGDGYLVSTNFSLADDDASAGWRYERATSMLDDLSASTPLTPAYARDTLAAVSLNMLTTFTLYSNVFDLVNQTVYLNYMSQYGETVEFDLHEELRLGSRVMEMRDLFSPEVAAAGDDAYGSFAVRFKATIVGVIAGLAVCLGLGVWLVIRRRARRSVIRRGTTTA